MDNHNISRLLREIAGGGRLDSIKGIGKNLAAKIMEYVNKGKVEYYEGLKRAVPQVLTQSVNSNTHAARID